MSRILEPLELLEKLEPLSPGPKDKRTLPLPFSGNEDVALLPTPYCLLPSSCDALSDEPGRVPVCVGAGNPV